MYDFLDRPVSSLDRGGRFLIWSARSWVKAVDETKCPVNSIAHAFGNWNMLPGLQPFLRMMALFNRHGLENFQFCALQCNHVSEHEAIMISMVCAIRDAPPDVVRETIELLVEEEVVGNIIIALWQLDQAMGAAGIQPGAGRVAYLLVPPTPDARCSERPAGTADVQPCRSTEVVIWLGMRL